MTFSTIASSATSNAVFVHGWSCGSEDWSGVATLLSARVNAVMARLPGSLDGPPLLPAASLQVAAEEVLRQALQQGCEEFALVGHSMGARIALELAAKHPERVTRLLLVDGSNVPDDPIAATETLVRRIEQLGRREWAAQTIGSMMVENLTVEQENYLIKRTSEHDDRTLVEYYKTMMEWDRDQFMPALARITCPVTLLQATSVDENRIRRSVSVQPSSRWVDAFRAHVPGVEISLVPGAGHFLMLERPDLVADWINTPITTSVCS